MMSRRSIPTLALTLAVLAGCDLGNNGTGVGGSADDMLIRVINTTGTALDLTSNGQVIGGTAHVDPRTTSTCIHIAPSTGTVGLREAGKLSDVGGFAPVVTPREGVTVVAYTSDIGSITTLTLPDDFIPTSGLVGLRVVDVAPTLGLLDVYVTPRSGPLGVPSIAGVGFGGNTGFFDADPGINQVRFTTATTSTVVFDAGTFTFQVGRLYTLVVSQPGGAGVAPAASLVPAC